MDTVLIIRSSKFGPVGPNGSKRLWDSPYARGRCPCIFSVRRTAAACELPPNNSLRFVEWYPKRPAKQLPLTLEASEYQDIVHSNALFCRKVAIPESLELMNLIDEKCLGN